MMGCCLHLCMGKAMGVNKGKACWNPQVLMLLEWNFCKNIRLNIKISYDGSLVQPLLTCPNGEATWLLQQSIASSLKATVLKFELLETSSLSWPCRYLYTDQAALLYNWQVYFGGTVASYWLKPRPEQMMKMLV